ncbi:MAG: 2-keto-3-deoxy-L-rhamnonate aldolase RhmA [Lysobacterales bacterium]|jgi:2-keto-3-deoxy-L-rhamnonate aldolase RhmA
MKPSDHSFRKRLRARDALIGTFVKSPSSIVCEVLGDSKLDAVCLDAEHAPFGRMQLDSCIHALRASGMPALVRLQSDKPEGILNVLDSGATGIVVPHVMSADQAEAIAKSAHYGRGGRGFAASSRAAGYIEKKMADHLRDSKEQTTVIVQIEDIEAVDVVEEIASVKGVDCLFVGRIDLTVAYGAESPDDPRVIAAVERICAAGKAVGMAVGMYVPNVRESQKWIEKGASLFLLESDQAFLAKGAEMLFQQFTQRGNLTQIR